MWTAAVWTLTGCVCPNPEPQAKGCLNWEPPLLQLSPTQGLTSGQECGPSVPPCLEGVICWHSPTQLASQASQPRLWQHLPGDTKRGLLGKRSGPERSGGRGGGRERQRKGCGKWQAPEGGE